MFRLLLFIIAASIFSFTSTASALDTTAKEPAKQFDLAKKLVDTLGFGEGLPDKPVEKDYLDILGGNRTFRFEAEDTFDRKSDPVVVHDIPVLGPFSGKGWVQAATGKTAVHFKVFIPISGKYTLKVTAKGDDQLWSIAGRAFKLNSGAKLKESVLGQLFISAGELEFNAVIPPSGAIDNFIFTANAYTPVEPLSGWSPAKPLTADALNEVFASLLTLDPLLPDDLSYNSKIIEVATQPDLPETVQATDNQVLGKPVAAKWIRASQSGAIVPVRLEIESLSVYRIRVHALGKEMAAAIGKRVINTPLKPYLEWVDLGTFRLAEGTNILTLQLPPTGGVDVIEVTRKNTSPANYAAVTKTARQGGVSIQTEELDSLIKSLQGQFKERK